MFSSRCPDTERAAGRTASGKQKLILQKQLLQKNECGIPWEEFPCSFSSLARAEFPIQTSMFLNVKITAQVRMRREKK